ncbi:MAG: DUF2577 family protein [Clostridiaceae bacterium]
MDGFVELAKLFRERDNPDLLGIDVGKVVSVSPLKVSLGNRIILDLEFLIVSENAYYKYELNNGSLVKTNNLTIGDEVVLIPTPNKQTFFLIDKVVRI